MRKINFPPEAEDNDTKESEEFHIKVEDMFNFFFMYLLNSSDHIINYFLKLKKSSNINSNI